MDSKCKNRNYFWHLRCVFVIFSLLPALLWAQYHFNFECNSGSGSNLFPGSTWEQVPENRWELSEEGAIEGTCSLRHAYDNPESGIDYLIFNHDRPGDADSLVISFRMRHGFAPSSANNWQVALLAEFHTEDLRIEEGIVVGVNFRGSDDLIRIWQKKGGEVLELCVTQINYQEEAGTDLAPLFRLVWQRDGLLSLFYTKDPYLEDPRKIGSCVPEQVPGGRQLVFRYKYTSARDRNLWLDELILDGTFIRDSLAPRVRSLEVMGENTLELAFSEAVVNPEDGTFLVGENRGKVLRNGGKKVELEFPESFPNRSPQELHIGNLCDADQNCMQDTLLAFMRNEAVWGDVVFNEIMSDPDPPVRLPEEEYLELYNRSEFSLDLEKWILEVNTRSYFLGELKYTGSDSIDPSLTLLPDGFLLVKGMALPNKGAVLALYNEAGNLVHAVSYGVPWNAPEWKVEGGWSLESPDPDQLCLVSRAWTYSENPRGGTPGQINSNYAPAWDQDPPLMLYYGYGEEGVVILHYSEPVLLAGLDREDFILNPGSVQPLEVSLSFPLSDRVQLRFQEDIQDRRQYTMEVPVLTDCQGNTSREEILKGGKISPPAYGDLFINEIMYDPLDGNPEFVELYNPGPAYFDLQDLAIQVAEPGESSAKPHPLSIFSRMVLPGQYLVITSSVAWLVEAYGLAPSGSWVEVESLPDLKNSGASLYLSDRSGATVDLAVYNENMHMDLLGDTKGISLERISMDRSGSDAGNWHSAASIVGYATPGEENSQALDPLADTDVLEVEPAVFSPDNDGFQDVLNICVKTRIQGCVLTLWITDLTGAPIRQLANNHIAALSVTYSWDGEDEGGSMVSAGVYVIHFFAYHPATGKRWRKRSAIGVIYR